MLPVYMVAPKFYADHLGVGLLALGLCLFLTRLIDTVQDPFIGRWVDALSRVPQGWTMLMMGATVLLALSFVALFSPKVSSQTSLLVWLSVCLIVVYTAHSMINICYLAWGARLTDDPVGRSRVTAWREAIGIVGVIVASILPVSLTNQYGAQTGYAWFAYSFVVILVLSAWVTLRLAPRPRVVPLPAHAHWREALSYRPVKRLYVFYLFNATSVAIPATLILFYIDDVLQTPAYAGLFLAVYFFSGLVTLPVWVWLASRLGKTNAWALGAVMASAALVWAATLGQGDVVAYALICCVAGMALGADLALPPAMLADAIPEHKRDSTGLYFGVWALIAKFALALSAGIALPVLGWLGYQPGEPASAQYLPIGYAILPLSFKCLAFWVIKPWTPSTHQTGSSS